MRMQRLTLSWWLLEERNSDCSEIGKSLMFWNDYICMIDLILKGNYTICTCDINQSLNHKIYNIVCGPSDNFWRNESEGIMLMTTSVLTVFRLTRSGVGQNHINTWNQNQSIHGNWLIKGDFGSYFLPLGVGEEASCLGLLDNQCISVNTDNMNKRQII